MGEPPVWGWVYRQGVEHVLSMSLIPMTKWKEFKEEEEKKEKAVGNVLCILSESIFV